MRHTLITFLLAAGMLMFGVAQAQQAGQDNAAPSAGAQQVSQENIAVPPVMLEQHASAWKSLLGTSSANVGLVVAGFGVLAIALLFLLRKRGGGKRDAGPLAYESGYETIDPNAKAQAAPAAAQPSSTIASRPRTDTIIAPWSVPAEFDVPRFLRKSKAYFMRLQASWDKGDVRDIRQFTTRDMFGEFCKQLNERGDAANATEVVTLGAELLGVDAGDTEYVATVKFTGMIKEAPKAPAEPFAEVWNMSKPTDGTRSWVIASIQQY